MIKHRIVKAAGEPSLVYVETAKLIAPAEWQWTTVGMVVTIRGKGYVTYVRRSYGFEPIGRWRTRVLAAEAAALTSVRMDT